MRTPPEPKAKVHACAPLCIHVSIREQGVLKGIASGSTVAQVARATGYTTHGVRAMLRRIRRKVVLRNHAEVVAWAIRNGVIK